MTSNSMEQLQSKICGKRIVSIEPSKWSGEVRPYSENQDYVSISLEDGTVLEVEKVYIRDGRPGNPPR